MSIWIKKLLLVVYGLLLIIPVAHSQTVGRVVLVLGKVRAFPSMDWVEEDRELAPGEILGTGQDGVVVLELPQGRVKLNPLSNLKIDQTPEQLLLLRLQRGSFYLRQQQNRPVFLQTPELSFLVEEGQFFLAQGPGEGAPSGGPSTLYVHQGLAKIWQRASEVIGAGVAYKKEGLQEGRLSEVPWASRLNWIFAAEEGYLIGPTYPFTIDTKAQVLTPLESDSVQEPSTSAAQP